MTGSVSPPPVKRRKVMHSQSGSSLGQTFQAESSASHMRIYSWNVNGLSPFLQPPITSFFGSKGSKATQSKEVGTPTLRGVLRRYDWPEMLLLQEVKINPDDNASQRAVEKALTRAPNEPIEEPAYRAFFCLPKDKFNARGFGRKVYGVCNIVREDFIAHFCAKFREVDWDLEGRFLVCETEARQSIPRLAIFNCYFEVRAFHFTALTSSQTGYMVNGTEAPYKSSQNGEFLGTRHDRKLRVHELLQAECRALEKEDVGVILAGDMNVARTKLDGHPNLRTHPTQHCINRADFKTRFFDKMTEGSLQMIDTFRHLYPKKAGYTYYPRQTSFGSSCDRVDLIMLSKVLGRYLKQAEMDATPVGRGPSDHVPLFAELDFSPLGDHAEEEAAR